METKVLVAIIAGTSGLLVAVFSLIGSIVTTLTASRTSKQVEQLRLTFDASSARRSTLDKETATVLDTLREALSSIQVFKDAIQVALSVVEGNLATGEVLLTLTEARKRVFAAYEDHLAHLSEEELRALHYAKGLALKCCEVLANASRDAACVAEIGGEARTELSHLRLELTDVQQTLRDSRAYRLAKLSLG